MLTNYTHNNQKRINNIVGKPYSLLERVNMNGIASPEMEITKASIQINNLLILDQNIDSCNIELRPKGIIISFQKLLETYLLVIPYYKLSIYKGSLNTYSFFKDQYHIKILAPKQHKEIHQFISKILSEKEKNTPTRIEDL